MKTDKELADELDAKDRLRGRGYLDRTCSKCHGTGLMVERSYPCYHCEGRGYVWESPSMRAFREARKITPEAVKQARDGVDKAMKRAAVQIRKMNEALERKITP